MASEKQFENRVKKFLKDEGCWLVKYWAGAVFTKTGIPDLLVCCNGHFLAIELKASNGKPTDLQLWNIDQIRKAGGVGLILYPKDFNYLKELIQDLKRKG